MPQDKSARQEQLSAKERQQLTPEDQHAIDDAVGGYSDAQRAAGTLGESVNEASRMALSKTITKPEITAGTEYADIPPQEVNETIRRIIYEGTLAAKNEPIAQYTGDVSVTQDGEIDVSKVKDSAKKSVQKAQGILSKTVQAFGNIFNKRKQAEREASQEAYSFVTAELMRIMVEIYQSLALEDEEEKNDFWAGIRVSLSTTSLLPLTMLQIVRKIPIFESFQYMQEHFWLKRISRKDIVDRHGTLKKGKQPVDETLQSDGSSHTSMAVYSKESRERTRKMDQSEQIALRLVASLTQYIQKGQDKRFLLDRESDAGMIKVGFRTREQFFHLDLSLEEIQKSMDSSPEKFIHQLAQVIQALQSGNGPESVKLDLRAQRLLQKHAYKGRHSLHSVDSAFLNADVTVLLEPGQAGQNEMKQLTRPDYITGGSHMKEVILPLVDSEGNVVAEANKFAHTWWQGNEAERKQRRELNVVDFLSQYYLKKKESGALEDSESDIVARLQGVNPEELRKKIVDVASSQEAKQWRDLIDEKPETFIYKTVTERLAPEWVAEHTIPFDTIKQWNDRITALREKGIKLTTGDLLNFAATLAGKVPSLQGVAARNINFEGNPNTEVLDVLHILSLGDELQAAFQGHLAQPDQQFSLKGEKILKKVDLYRRNKKNAKDGRSWASFFATLTGGSLAGVDLTRLVSGVSKSNAMVGERAVDAVQGEHGLMSLLKVPRNADIDSANDYLAQQYFFTSANTSSYRPENRGEQIHSTFLGAIGTALGGKWEDGEFQMEGLRITQRVLPDQALNVILHHIENTPGAYGRYNQEIQDALRTTTAAPNEEGLRYDPDDFARELLSKSVPKLVVMNTINSINKFMEEQYMPEFLSQIEVAAEWLLGIFENLE